VNVTGIALPAVTDRSDSAAMGLLRTRFCAAKEQTGPASINARALIRRNVLQHLGAKDPQIAAKLLKSSGSATVEQWCSMKAGPAIGPEWYLRFRDMVVQARKDSP
jgi:hypothetical protein